MREKKLRISVELNVSTVKKLTQLAEKDSRKRKAYMELVLVNHANGNPPTIERNQIK